jgi:hypothetical protein
MSVSKLFEDPRGLWLALFALYILLCIVVEAIQRIRKTRVPGTASEPLVSVLLAACALIVTIPMGILAWLMMGPFVALQWLSKVFGQRKAGLSKSAQSD